MRSQSPLRSSTSTLSPLLSCATTSEFWSARERTLSLSFVTVAWPLVMTGAWATTPISARTKPATAKLIAHESMNFFIGQIPPLSCFQIPQPHCADRQPRQPHDRMSNRSEHPPDLAFPAFPDHQLQ